MVDLCVRRVTRDFDLDWLTGVAVLFPHQNFRRPVVAGALANRSCAWRVDELKIFVLDQLESPIYLLSVHVKEESSPGDKRAVFGQAGQCDVRLSVNMRHKTLLLIYSPGVWLLSP